MKYIFLAGGRTGGPIIPLLSISQYLNEYTPIIFGIRNSFEAKYAKDHQIEFVTLFEAKSRVHSFRSKSTLYNLVGYLQVFSTSLFLFLNIAISIYWILKKRPKGIFSAGGFTAVPLVFATVFTNKTRLCSSKIILHQQDPDVGITHRLISRFADYLTCMFEESKKSSSFKDAEITFNPINYEKFNKENVTALSKNHKLFSFLNTKDKPIFLVFGGGSGSEAINHWVWKQIDSLVVHFKIIHLTGSIQRKKPKKIVHKNYLSFEALHDEMPVTLTLSDVVMCRAGLGSISELLYLHKPAFLVPLPNSHQEKNAFQVSKYFEVLSQEDSSKWLELILTSFPTKFKQKKYPSRLEIENQITQYIYNIRNLLDK